MCHDVIPLFTTTEDQRLCFEGLVPNMRHSVRSLQPYATGIIIVASAHVRQLRLREAKEAMGGREVLR